MDFLGSIYKKWCVFVHCKSCLVHFGLSLKVHHLQQEVYWSMAISRGLQNYSLR